MYSLRIIALRVLLTRCVYPRTLIMLPGYAFIKTHKVGGTTVMYLLRNTLSHVHNTTQCDYFNKYISNIPPDPTKTPGCRICAGHDSYRQIAASIRSPSSLIAQNAVRKVCPFWVPERRIHTMIMLREPVDRLYAALRGAAAQRAHRDDGLHLRAHRRQGVGRAAAAARAHHPRGRALPLVLPAHAAAAPHLRRRGPTLAGGA